MLRVFTRCIRRIAMSESHSSDPFLVRKRGCVGCKNNVKRPTLGAVEPAHGPWYSLGRREERCACATRDTVVRKPNSIKMCF